MDPDDDLQRVARPARSGVWIGAWAAGLGAVVAVALIGSLMGSGPAPSAPLAVVGTASPSPAGSPTLTPEPTPSPTPWEGIPAFRGGASPTPRPRPVPSRPPIGEDGLMGGLVFGTNWPPD